MSDHVPTPEEEAMARDAGLTIQPLPKANQHPSAHEMVIGDLVSRQYMTEDHPADPLVELEKIYDQMLKGYIYLATLAKGPGAPLEEIRARKNFGLAKYGTLLQPFNGRDSLSDATDEMGDLLVYMATKIYELQVEREIDQNFINSLPNEEHHHETGW